MKYTKDEEARAERSSVKMWPGITAGIIIGLLGIYSILSTFFSIFPNVGH